VADILARTAAALGPTPRVALARSWRPRRPSWLGRGDGALARALEAAPRLLRDGEVTLSWAIIANNRLWTDAADPLPGTFLHVRPGASPIPAWRLPAMADVAARLRDGPLPADAEVAAAAKLLRDDYVRYACVPLPKCVTHGVDAVMSVLLVDPQALPRPRLATPLVPVLVLPGTELVMPLPSGLWAPDLVTAWVDLASGDL